jgi:hypothetical protein
MAFPKAGTTGEPRELCPPATYFATCVGLYDVGTRDNTFEGKTKKQHQVVLAFEVSGAKNGDGRPFVVSKFYTLSFGERATLRKDVESWDGKSYPKDHEYPVETLIDRPCMITVAHKERQGGGMREEIKSISGVPAGMPKPTSELDSIVYELDPSKDIPENVPVWIQNQIITSDEWVAVHGKTEPRTYDRDRDRPKPAGATTASGNGAAPGPAVPGSKPPQHIAPLLPAYGLEWPYSDDDLKGKGIPAAVEDMLREHSIPF